MAPIVFVSLTKLEAKMMQEYQFNGGIYYPTSEGSWTTEISPGEEAIRPPRDESELKYVLVE